MLLVAAVYPNQPEGRFDLDYYVERHCPFVENLLAPYGLRGLRIIHGLRGLDGGPPPYRTISLMWFDSQEGFDRGLADHGAEIFADAGNFTTLAPTLEIAEVALEMGVQ